MTWADAPAVFTDTFADELRLIVDGVDVTRFRDVPFESNGYQLKEPLEYGPASFRFPSVRVLEVRSDSSDMPSELRWLRKGARARLSPVTAGVEGRPVWRGIVSLVHVADGVVEVNCGGDAEGRLVWDVQPTPMFRTRADVGFWVTRAFQESRIPINPRFGPSTGILLDSRGSFEDRLTYVLGLLADAQHLNGTTWTILRNSADTSYEMVQKDTTTVDATLFAGALDKALDLVDDMVEQPNTIYGAGVNPNGSKWNGGVAPTLSPESAPAYPISGGGSFGVGTEDADTITGFGITVLNRKLYAEGLIDSVLDVSSVYTDDTEDAVRDLQRAAQLSVTGNVNSATWDALWDVSDTDLYSIADALILPIAQRTEVRQFRRKASGTIVDTNPGFDPNVPIVSRFVSNGVLRKQRFTNWANREMDRLDSKNWVGTITLSGQDLFAGDYEHGEASPILLSRYELRPGSNVMLRDFDGDTLFHVSGINVNGDGTTVLAVDTQARDLRTIGEIVARNKESRRNRGREFKQEHRASGATRDAIVSFWEKGGILPQDIPVSAETWKVFPIPAGQEGTIAKLRIKVETSAFWMAIFGEEVTRQWLNKHIGDPTTVDADGNSVWMTTGQQNRLFNQRVLLYAAGTSEEPCGFWPKRHTNDAGDVTSAPVTGVHYDDGGFPYRCYGLPVVWVAIYAAEDAVVQAGRILWEQIEEGF